MAGVPAVTLVLLVPFSLSPFGGSIVMVVLGSMVVILEYGVINWIINGLDPFYAVWEFLESA
jgi:hypothetical protein